MLRMEWRHATFSATTATIRRIRSMLTRLLSVTFLLRQLSSKAASFSTTAASAACTANSAPDSEQSVPRCSPKGGREGRQARREEREGGRNAAAVQTGGEGEEEEREGQLFSTAAVLGSPVRNSAARDSTGAVSWGAPRCEWGTPVLPHELQEKREGALELVAGALQAEQGGGGGAVGEPVGGARHAGGHPGGLHWAGLAGLPAMAAGTGRGGGEGAPPLPTSCGRGRLRWGGATGQGGPEPSPISKHASTLRCKRKASRRSPSGLMG